MRIPLLGGLIGRGFFLPVLVCLLAFPAGVAAQVLVPAGSPDGTVRLHTGDLAVFTSGEQRDDLPCSVSPTKPFLGFDLRFHTGYEIAIPLNAVAGKGDLLTVLFRVIPPNDSASPVYFSQRIVVPPIDEGARGNAYLEGGFDVGAGKYKVEWLMRDRGGKVCSSFWDFEAKLSGKDARINLNIAPGEVRQTRLEQFAEEPPLIRTGGEDTLSVKILVNFSPQNPHSATLQPMDTSALVAILRALAREPRIGKFSVVAFNLHEQRVLYRQENADRIDFPALGDSLETLELGTIDLQRLSDKHWKTGFLARLIEKEFASADQPDALILAGPKAMLGRKVPERELAALGELECPVYYLNYNLYPYTNPWRDTIGDVVKYFKGREFMISRPRDLWFAVTNMVTEIEQGKRRRERMATSE